MWFATLPLADPEPFAADDPSETVATAVAFEQEADAIAGPESRQNASAAPSGNADGWDDSFAEAGTGADLTYDMQAAAENASPDEDEAQAAPEAVAIENVAASSARVAKKGRGQVKSGAKKFALRVPTGQFFKKAAPYAAFAICLLAVFAVAMREPLARSAPWTGKIFAAIGLPVAMTAVAIANVRSELSKLDKADVLIVEGELTNRGSRSVPVPPVRISVRDESGTEIYSWSADVMKPTLEGGESSPFRARLASPPSNGRSVAVRFGQAPADSPNKAAPKKS